MFILPLLLLGFQAVSIFCNIIEFNNFAVRKKHLPFIQLVTENSTISVIEDEITSIGEQNSDKCSNDSFIINSAEELYYLQKKCTFLQGSLIINKGYNERVVDLGNIREINGDIIVEANPNIFKIDGEHLEKIGNKFHLMNLMSLVTVNFPALRKIRSINWRVVPVLNNIDIGNRLNGLKYLTISDSSISDLNVFKNVQELAIFNINNNRFLETIESDLISVKKQLTIHANADELVITLNSLYSVDNITVRDASEISLPNLTQVNSSMEFIDNYFSELHLPNLQKIDGTLGIIDNPNLNSVNFEGLKSLNGGLMIANNTKLDNIDFFPNLKQIGGAIYFDGSFNSTDMPKLKLVKGSAYIKSSSDQFNCKKWFTPVNGKAIIRGGNIKCIAKDKKSLITVNEDGSIEETSDHENNIDDLEDKETIEQTNKAASLKTIMSVVTLSNCLILSLLILFVS
ncbi:Sporulation-specific protein 22 [Nakaseomyces bracarensis]|uniref:Sporulation-specific protein 22 n=1 Tax=Nakaseomyces bracarensis TaxID=273131 RepID=A0ABR4NTQ7_9SACH